MSKIKIGVFGARRGFAFCQVLAMYPQAEVTAVCDFHKPLLDALGQTFREAGLEVTCYNNFDDFLAHDMDAVILANYAMEHAPYAIRCLKAGKHVLSELLPCETMAQAVELVETVEASGKVYAYGENCCYRRDSFEMWKRLRSGELGEVKFAQGEYIHDACAESPRLTLGDREHWRNRKYPTFYCTHSLGPLIAMSGHRPVQVTGYETPGHARSYFRAGLVGGGSAGIIMAVLDNGAVLESVSGGLRRQPTGCNWTVYCEEGFMMSTFLDEDTAYYEYLEEPEYLSTGSWKKYVPANDIEPELAQGLTTHEGTDFYCIHFFVQKILGMPDGRWSIDIYQALDMAFCGILAHRSVLAGNKPVRIPDFRDPAQREPYRNDHACVTPEVAGDQLLARSALEHPRIPDSVFERIKSLHKAGLNANGETREQQDERYARLRRAFFDENGFPKKRSKE